jgi:hypothetical protein
MKDRLTIGKKLADLAASRAWDAATIARRSSGRLLKAQVENVFAGDSDVQLSTVRNVAAAMARNLRVVGAAHYKRKMRLIDLAAASGLGLTATALALRSVLSLQHAPETVQVKTLESLLWALHPTCEILLTV